MLSLPYKTAPPDSPFCKVLSAKSVVFTERNIIIPLLHPSDKTASPDSPFHKVLFTKSVVFAKRWIYFPLFLSSPHLVLPYG